MHNVGQLADGVAGPAAAMSPGGDDRICRGLESQLELNVGLVGGRYARLGPHRMRSIRTVP
jgi:hypothetical protein